MRLRAQANMVSAVCWGGMSGWWCWRRAGGRESRNLGGSYKRRALVGCRGARLEGQSGGFRRLTGACCDSAGGFLFRLFCSVALHFISFVLISFLTRAWFIILLILAHSIKHHVGLTWLWLQAGEIHVVASADNEGKFTPSYLHLR